MKTAWSWRSFFLQKPHCSRNVLSLPSSFPFSWNQSQPKVLAAWVSSGCLSAKLGARGRLLVITISVLIPEECFRDLRFSQVELGFFFNIYSLSYICKYLYIQVLWDHYKRFSRYIWQVAMNILCKIFYFLVFSNMELLSLESWWQLIKFWLSFFLTSTDFLHLFFVYIIWFYHFQFQIKYMSYSMRTDLLEYFFFVYLAKISKIFRNNKI